MEMGGLDPPSPAATAFRSQRAVGSSFGATSKIEWINQLRRMIATSKIWTEIDSRSLDTMIQQSATTAKVGATSPSHFQFLLIIFPNEEIVAKVTVVALLSPPPSDLIILYFAGGRILLSSI